MEEPGKELGSVQQEARTCPVCGTKLKDGRRFNSLLSVRNTASTHQRTG